MRHENEARLRRSLNPSRSSPDLVLVAIEGANRIFDDLQLQPPGRRGSCRMVWSWPMMPWHRLLPLRSPSCRLRSVPGASRRAGLRRFRLRQFHSATAGAARRTTDAIVPARRRTCPHRPVRSLGRRCPKNLEPRPLRSHVVVGPLVVVPVAAPPPAGGTRRAPLLPDTGRRGGFPRSPNGHSDRCNNR